MLPIEFPENTSNMRYEYHRVREGPNFFITYYKNSSRLIYDPKDAWRTLEVAKFTDTGKALKEWCLAMDEEYGTAQRAKWSELANDLGSHGESGGRVDTSFASEVQAEHDPTENTKMVM
jgi:hypothetical protein